MTSLHNGFIIFTAPAQCRFLFITLLLFCISTSNSVKNYKFDYLVFSQRWLPSACMEYINHNLRSSDVKHCILPENYDLWTIHGLWPTQDKREGPFFCNRSMPFDINKVKSIESELKLNWPNIEDGKIVSSLWQHEWEKHGTCAAQLESLNNVLKYFKTTLNFFKTYNMQDLMEKNALHILKNGVTISELLFIIKNAFGKTPQIHCIQKVKSDKSFLSEIRLCLNKNLELINCGMMVKTRGYSKEELEALTDCPANKTIIIPEKVDVQVNNKVLLQNSTELNHHNTYDTLEAIIKFTNNVLNNKKLLTFETVIIIAVELRNGILPAIQQEF